ncbi:MAG: peptidase inhibitor family I36 protein [Sphingomonas sp.]
MRQACLGVALLTGLFAGVALASDDPPATASQDSRWRSVPEREMEPDTGPVGPPAPAVAARSCTAFENDNYGGRRLDLHDGTEMEWVGRGWNDRISSVACASGCRLIAYQTIVFGGARANFTGARPTLGTSWDDRISALRVACDGDHAAASASH